MQHSNILVESPEEHSKVYTKAYVFLNEETSSEMKQEFSLQIEKEHELQGNFITLIPEIIMSSVGLMLFHSNIQCQKSLENT